MSGWISFAGLAYGLSWLLWVPTALMGRDVMSSAWLIPFFLGGFGPSAAAILLAIRQGSLRDLIHRLVDWRRIPVVWYLIILCGLPAMVAMVLGISWTMDLPQPGLEGLRQVLANPIVLLGMVLLGIFTGPLSEELGWRGFALESLQQSWRPFKASLVLAPIWWAWHLPLFFIEGSNQAAWGLLSVDSLFFLLNIFPLTYLMTLIYNQTRGSVFAAVLVHFVYNFTLGLVYPPTVAFHILQFIGLAMMALVIHLMVRRNILYGERPPGEMVQSHAGTAAK